MKSLIAVTGLKRSGKDTFGDYLVREYGYKKAQPLACFKPALQQWFAFSDEQMYGNLKEVVDNRWGISPRTLMQDFGTDLMKTCLSDLEPGYAEKVGDNLWALIFKNWYNNAPEGNYVLCDLRFKEELDIIKHLENVTTVRVINYRCDNTDNHISEKNIKKLKVDCEIINNSTFENYYNKIDNLLNYINSKKSIYILNNI